MKSTSELICSGLGTAAATAVCGAATVVAGQMLLSSGAPIPVVVLAVMAPMYGAYKVMRDHRDRLTKHLADQKIELEYLNAIGSDESYQKIMQIVDKIEEKEKNGQIPTQEEMDELESRLFQCNEILNAYDKGVSKEKVS